MDHRGHRLFGFYIDISPGCGGSHDNSVARAAELRLACRLVGPGIGRGRAWIIVDSINVAGRPCPARSIIMMKKVLYGLVLLALFLLPASPAYAQGPHDGRLIIGQDFTLKSGETLNGDLVVIGGQAAIEKTASVHGDIVVVGGSLRLEGSGTGNAVVIGGVAALGAQSSVAGDVVTVGGSLQRAEGAKIGGNIVTNLPPPTLNV